MAFGAAVRRRAVPKQTARALTLWPERREGPTPNVWAEIYFA